MKNLLRNKVKKLLDENHRVGSKNGIVYDYTCPSPGMYSHQWLWDSCFHAIVLTHFDFNRAKNEIRTLLLKQAGSGFIPCVVFWESKNLIEKFFYFLFEKGGIIMITQSPVIPVSVEEIYKKSEDKEFLKEVYPKLKLFMDWLYQNRDPNHLGLIEVIHPWETGIDNTPSTDRQLGIRKNNPSFFKVLFSLLWVMLKYFLIGWDDKRIKEKKIFVNKSVLFNSVYGKSLKSMIYIARELGKFAEAKEFNHRYERTLDSLIKKCWSDKSKIFFDLDKEGNQVEIKTISSLMPLILPDLPKMYTKDLVKHLNNKQEFWSEYPIPSVSMNEPTFNPNKNLVLYRGPTWVHTNWFITRALIEKGYKSEARIIIKKTKEMVEKNGFWEFYNPLTSEGYGQPNFGWSTLILDMCDVVIIR